MKITIRLVIFMLLFSSCNPDKRLIEKNLNSRFTKYEIVEFRKDTAYVKQASWTLLSLKIGVSETNLKISKTLNDIVFKTGSRTPVQNLQYIDSLHDVIVNRMDKFEKSRFDRVDPCYYVKYLIHKEDRKIAKEEYFYINRQNDDIICRPCEWNEYMFREGYDELIKEVLSNSDEIYEVRRNLAKK